MPDEWKAIDDAWRDLKSIIWNANRDQKEKFLSALSAALSAADRGTPDLQLLEEILGFDGMAPAQYLAGKTFAGFCHPALELPEDGEIEPDSYAFNSILPSLAASMYDYGMLGRILLGEGACQLFAGGPWLEQRAEAFLKVIFGFPIPRSEAEKAKQMWYFVMEVDAMGVDEPVDASGIRPLP